MPLLHRTIKYQVDNGVKEFMESSKAKSFLLFRSAVLMDAVIALAPRIRIFLEGLQWFAFV
jgi:hypothetical protein